MNAEQLEKTVYRIKPEVVILDDDDRIILLVKAKGNREIYGNVSEAISWLKAGNGAIPFVMFIDIENIQIFKWESGNLSAPVCILNTAEVLSPYGLEISDKWISGDYLGSTAQSWLNDLGYHWKSPTPPAEEQIAAIGLLSLLKNGTAQPEVEIRIDSKLRYIVLKYFFARPDDF
ncbi:hypothetical protein [Aerosakkonema funiforme]|uniref:hypothetical protein n=1 Tax=Aerosakkonema funiforme TaxID=1246630 RepID=UPI0035B9B2B2